MMRDHPVIEAMERTGYPDDSFQIPHCPVCGSECSTIYRVRFLDEIIGCDECLVSSDAWECKECFKENEE
jgi:hypothetical protein